jgi:cytochrome c2
MPTFGLEDQQLNGVINYFGSISNNLEPFQTHEMVRTASSNDTVGRQLFEQLKCQQCHVLGTIPKDQPTSNLAPDLRMSPERLNPEWILEWLKRPSDILPGTRMPAFWADYPASLYKRELKGFEWLPSEFNGNAELQIRAIRDHLLTFRGGPSPKAGAAKTANNN